MSHFRIKKIYGFCISIMLLVFIELILGLQRGVWVLTFWICLKQTNFQLVLELPSSHAWRLLNVASWSKRWEKELGLNKPFMKCSPWTLMIKFRVYPRHISVNDTIFLSSINLKHHLRSHQNSYFSHMRHAWGRGKG